MRVLNITRNEILADRAILASNIWQRTVGLLGRDCLGEGEGMILHPCNSVHTCFMRFPIDVVFVDKRGRVLKILPELMPFRFSPLVLRSDFVVELPTGIIGRTGTEIEDHLTLLA